MHPESLPIDAVLPEVVESLRRHPALVLAAPTGAGKTTRVPPYLLESGLAGDGQIVMLEPRRLAARAAARRMAAERGCRLGEEVGYQVRFDRKSGPRTRILVVTEGMLVRLLQGDPYLEHISVLIFDEFHERSLDTDLALGMARLVQTTVRPDLRIVVMSATLAAEAVAAYLGNCPVVASQGRLYPVEIRHEARSTQQTWPAAAAQGVEKLLDRTPGDILVFLPGMREIRQTAGHLEELARARALLIVPLHGDLPAEQQDLALLPQPQRKIVLATNVAETSVTVAGITGVVDTGLARIVTFDPHTGLDRLRIEAISRASAEQRAGRAGRTQPGVCLRLWSEAAHRQRPEQTPPEVARVDLAGPVLQLLCWGEKAVEEFPWFEPPLPDHVAAARTLLRRLGAVADAGVTPLGRMLARLPVQPRIGCLLVEGARRGHLDKTALAAALLAERDPFGRPEGRREPSYSDVLDRVHALEEFEYRARDQRAPPNLHAGAARLVLQARTQLQRLYTSLIKPESDPRVSADEAVLRGLLAAFPDRLARRREPGSRKGLMVGGRGVQLAPSSAVTQPALFLCIDVDAGQAEVLVRQASGVERDWLPPERLTTSVNVVFDPAAEKVCAFKQVRYEDLVLQENSAALPGEDQVTPILLEAAVHHWERVVPAQDSPAGQYVTRVRCLRGWLPELDLPDFDEAALRGLLPEVCAGCKSFAEVRQAPWLSVLQYRLTALQRQAVEREAPERLPVPSGSRLALTYELGRPPVLAVRIQEVFGWSDTPRVAGGRVRVLLHLLAPSHRPQQVTDDLASFWANTYPRIRKELRVRYPKHAWPEDPTTAPAESRPRRRP